MTATHASESMTRLIGGDAVGQLCQRDGRMAELAVENGEVMLDWVDGVQRLLDTPGTIEEVEGEARDILRDIRGVIWAGMGGSVMAVRVLAEVFGGSSDLSLIPLDSTDPAALNEVVGRIAASKGMPVKAIAGDPAALRALLGDTLMVAVAMGMTSEEPITHLEWFIELLDSAELALDRHVVVMALPGSYLDRFARERDLPVRPIQVDSGSGTIGRLSAPTTRAFLLPAALLLQSDSSASVTLRDALRRAWKLHDLDGARRDPESHPFVRLAAALADRSANGALLITPALPEAWSAVFPWVEQLFEESLGKGGKGIVLLEPQGDGSSSAIPQMRVVLATRSATPRDVGDISVVPYLSEKPSIAGVAALFLGWELCMALYAWLNDIHFAGQPAVENYKSRARALRERGDPLREVSGWRHQIADGPVIALMPPGMGGLPNSVARAVAGAVDGVQRSGSLGYVDLTYNGELSSGDERELREEAFGLAADRGVLCKFRRAPSAYHSTEQSEMDGPAGVFSVRIVAREHEHLSLGLYDDTFLLAQAVATWQAMLEAGRSCCLLIIERGTAAPDLVRSLRLGNDEVTTRDES